MQCPQCGAHTEVSEKRGPFRERRCTNTACAIDFTTREHVMSLRGHRRPCARTRATKLQTPNPPRVAGAGEEETPPQGAAGGAVNSTSAAMHGAALELAGGAGSVQPEQWHREAGAGA
jgi:hypothetical protein